MVLRLIYVHSHAIIETSTYDDILVNIHSPQAWSEYERLKLRLSEIIYLALSLHKPKSNVTEQLHCLDTMQAVLRLIK